MKMYSGSTFVSQAISWIFRFLGSSSPFDSAVWHPFFSQDCSERFFHDSEQFWEKNIYFGDFIFFLSRGTKENFFGSKKIFFLFSKVDRKLVEILKIVLRNFGEKFFFSTSTPTFPHLCHFDKSLALHKPVWTRFYSF